ncbi:MAG TPA: hypothetical protein DIC46_08975, partial [Porphyromonadaceae bacterium]|nr:hypothetical protein [Porphyromonadaceae bacterium]
MNRKILFIFGTLLCSIIAMQAQSLSGTVYRDDSKETLGGAQVTVSDIRKTTLTDSEGIFLFSHIPEGTYEVSVSYIGMTPQTKTVTLSGKSTERISFYLTEDAQSLSEITVTAPGDRKEVKEIKRSGVPVTVIDGSSFSGRGTSIEDVLNHQVGVKLRNTGGVGDESKVNVRGLEGNRVQIYVNGMPLNTPDGSFSINDLP